ncbi:MAG: peptide chain release factor N(5)-glutamine methyltransferase [candidate division Zixibacteria bacterium]|nr:peptide chain release factor N(5)-glutamine methyltransferase [candidate division Zixibacteria bacterium]
MTKYNINLLVSEADEKLKAVGIDAGKAEAEIILCDLLDVERLELYLNGPSLLDDNIVKSYYEIIEKRLTRYPLQYILGSAWFYGRKFLVDENVMVPCPETELLLESVLRTARLSKSSPVRLLDIGTGSGVVSASSKLENPELDVTASDISTEALKVAQSNARQFGVEENIKWIQSDLFDNIDPNSRFDIIASNPPYIADDTYDTLPPEVKADPTLSLLGGNKGMEIIERLLKQAPDFLNRPGTLIFEIGYDQAEIIFDLVDNNSSYSKCMLLKDLANIDRIVICKTA